MIPTLQQLRNRLTPLYDENEARAIMQHLLEVGFGLTLTDIICGRLQQMTDDNADRLEEMMHLLTLGEPLQYVLGKADFCGRTFHVEPGVLIPRPETEELCEWITHDMTASDSLSAISTTFRNTPSPTLLDIGTGSGCIAITLALNLPHTQVTAWDLSTDALRIANRNAQDLQAGVNFIPQDALHAPNDTAKWDVIVSNPPYICDKERADMAVNVLENEPAMALFVPDNNPLLFYHAIARYARQALKPGGRLYFEINPLYADEMKTMLEEEGMSEVITQKDAYGKMRMMRTTKKDTHDRT